MYKHNNYKVLASFRERAYIKLRFNETNSWLENPFLHLHKFKVALFKVKNEFLLYNFLNILCLSNLLSKINIARSYNNSFV